MSEKPEWFKLTGEDQEPINNVGKTGKRNIFKIAAVAAPLILVGAVVVGAAGEADDDERPAIDTTMPSATTVNSGSAQNETVAPASDKVNSKPTPVASKKVGVGVPAPSAKGGDDDHEGFFGDDDHQRGEHENREGHESREGHHEGGEHGGTAPKIPQPVTTTTKN
jgi:hypothetical protein